MQPDTIRQIRNHLRWSQAELARELGVTAATVARWEQGNRRPDKYHQLRIRQLLARVPNLAELDAELALLRATAPDDAAQAMDAVESAERSGLSPLAMQLAGNAALEAANGASQAEWILSKQHIDRDKLEAAISEVMGAGLWPWQARRDRASG